MEGSPSQRRHSARTEELTRGSDRHEEILHLSDSELVVSPQLLEQYLSVERKRNFKALCWLSSVFLFVVLAVAALLLSIGIVVLRSSEEAVTISRSLRDETDKALASYEDKIVGVVTDVKEADAGLKTLQSRVRAEKAGYVRDRTTLYDELERFGRYYDSKHSGLKTMIAGSGTMNETLRSVTAAEAARAAQFQEMAKWFRDQKEAASSGVSQPGNGGTTASTGSSLSAIIFGSENKTPDVGSAIGTEPPTTLPDEVAGTDEKAIVYSNGSKYEGAMLNGKKHGYGVFTFANGDSYVGEFRNDLRDGTGIYIYKSGARYDGGFRSGKRQGRGRYVYANGDRFEGEFRNGMKNGRGVYTYSSNGAVIKGYWKDNEPLIMD